MINHNIEYNSQKEDLTIAEYGRNVQNLIKYNKTIEDDVERQNFAEAIIHLMYQMNPVHINSLEYREKLWRHFFRIAEFDIKVMPPNGEMPSPESTRLKPELVAYPIRDPNYRHYGNQVKTMIAKAVLMDDKEKRQEFADTIGAYMKLAYTTWSSEHYVSDEVVKADIKKLSDGVLEIADDKSLDSLSSKVRKRPARPASNHNPRGGRRNYGRSGGSNRNNNNNNRRR